MLEIILTLISLTAIGGIVFFLYIKRKNERPDIRVEQKLTMETLLIEVKQAIADLAKDERFFGHSDVEWEAAYKRKMRILKALKNCIFGIESDKMIVRDLIRGVVAERVP